MGINENKNVSEAGSRDAEQSDVSREAVILSLSDSHVVITHSE